MRKPDGLSSLLRIFFAVAGFLLCHSLSAPGAARANDPSDRAKPDLQAVLLERYDKDGDGHLDPKERGLARRDFARQKRKTARALERFDSNQNGKIDPDERKVLQAERRRLREQRIERYDSDGDGRLSRAERATMRAQEKEKRQKRGE